MTAAIVSGLEGTGKTTQVLGLAKAFPPVVWGVLELKDKKKLERERSATFSVQILYNTHPRLHEKAMSVDPIQTLRNVVTWKNQIMALTTLPQTIVLDGISDLRDYAAQGWLIKHNEERIAEGKSHSKSIGGENIGAWMEINQAVRDLLEPLINLALSEDINLLMTAQFTDEWRGGVKIGEVPDLKPWMRYPVPCLFTLSRIGDEYHLECEKEPENAHWIIENLEKDKGLLTALLAHDVLTIDTETKKKLLAVQKTYMVRYTENGVSKRVFLEGIDMEEVKAAFEQDNPDVKGVSVIE